MYRRVKINYAHILIFSFHVHPKEETENEEYNGQLVKEGVSVAEWNEFLLQEHRLKGMLRFENGKVC